MFNPKKQDGVSRRNFLRQSACAALGVTGLVNTLANLRLMSAAMAVGPPAQDYKALVCIFLNGGNDSNNMLVPRSGEQRDNYDAARGVLALPAGGLHRIYPLNDTQDYGLHPQCKELADLFNQRKMAFVGNVGSLSYPIANRDEYLNGLVPVPPQLFSHSDQQVQWQSSIPDKPFQTGWGGRAADLLHSSYNASSNVSMSISLNGINNFQIGTSGDTAQYIIKPTAFTTLSGFGTNYSSALNGDGTYKDSNAGWRLKAMEEIMRLTHENLLEDAYADILDRARSSEAIIGTAFTAAAAAESTGGFTLDDIFTNNNANSKLGDQLKQIARLIAGRDALGNNRQIFFCRVGGYDTHQNQLASHDPLMDELNHAMKAFYDATQALGVGSEVTTFTASDFNRTFTPNRSDAQAGADHAWGGHVMVMGDAVQGGKIYGYYPELIVGDNLDVGNNRGRWIPTTAVDQYGTVLTKWLGADSSAIEAIFPNLGRFDDPCTVASANMDIFGALSGEPPIRDPLNAKLGWQQMR